jgi:Protein of unknown function (DUF2867)
MNDTAQRILLSELPAGSQIIQTLPKAHFSDCYRFADTHPELNAFDTFRQLMSDPPGWMNALMAIRNQAVRFVGLKHLGAMKVESTEKPSSSYRLGDRVGIFTLMHTEHKEVIVGDDDKHLRVQLSLFKHSVDGRATLSLSTVVHIHNTLGRVYMSVVGPVHQLIVPQLLKQVTRAAMIPPTR